MTESQFRKRAWYPILAVGLAMVSFIMIKTGRDAVFFQDWGIRRLPLAYIWIALAAAPAAIIHLNAMSHWGARRVRTALFVLSAGWFAAFVPFATAEHTIAMSILFISVPVLFGAVFAGAWLLIGDLLEGAAPATLRTIYSRTGASSMIGGMIGGLMSKFISLTASPSLLIACGALILSLIGLLVARAHNAHPADTNESTPVSDITSDSHETYGSDQAVLFRQKYIRLLMGISGLATIAALFIDFQFYAMSTLTGNNHAQFFANFYIILNLISLIIQLLVTPRLQSGLGIVGALLMLPMALLGGAGLFSVWTTLHARTVLRVLEGGLKASIYRSMWEQVYLPVQRRLRDAAKTIVDGVVQRMAEGVAAGVILIWFQVADAPVETLSFSWISWAIVITLLLWILLTRRLGSFGCNDMEPNEVLIRLPDG